MKIAIITAISLISLPAFAGGMNSNSQSGSWSSSGVNIGSALQAPSAIAPGLIASGISCAGSTSVGGSAAGWGVAFGFTRKDDACNAREDAKYIHGVTGSVLAAKERLCAVKEIRAAFARSGEPCAEDRARYASASAKPQTVRRTFRSISECERWVKETGAKAVCRAR